MFPVYTSFQSVSVPTLPGALVLVLFPFPRVPTMFSPQVHSVPSVFIPAECPLPVVDTNFQSVSVPILIGKVLFTLVPSPNCPLPL